MVRKLVLSFTALTLLTSFTCAEEVPLKDIWALDMSGTHDIYGLDLSSEEGQPGAPVGFEGLREFRESSIKKIQRDLSTKSPAEKAKPGFALSRTGLAALNGARYAIGEKNHVPTSSFAAGEDLTLVFFSHPSSYYVQIAGVSREENLITIHYRFVPHYTSESTVHVALVPLRDLPVGEYHVDVKQLPMEEKFLKAGFKLVDDEHSRRIVCQPFDISVVENATPGK